MFVYDPHIKLLTKGLPQFPHVSISIAYPPLIILHGDRVRVELSPYDLTEGYTTYFLINKEMNSTLY